MVWPSFDSFAILSDPIPPAASQTHLLVRKSSFHHGHFSKNDDQILTRFLSFSLEQFFGSTPAFPGGSFRTDLIQN